MKKETLTKILNENKIHEIYYNEKPVWVQELNNNSAKIGFLDGSDEQDVFIEDLYN